MRTIRDIIMRVENPPPGAADGVQILPLKFVTPEEVMAVVRPLMGFDEDSYVLEDGSLNIAVDALGTRLLVTGSEEKVNRLKEILKVVDVEVKIGEGGLPPEQPQLEVYAIKGGDPTMVLQVMQTLLAGLPDVRLAVDEGAGKLIALALRSQHDTIRATLKQMEQEGQQLAVIQLRSLDPQSAVLMINKLFGGDADPKNGGASHAPKVDADPVSGRLVVVGTKAQVDQIRDLLEKLDPSLDPGGIGSRGSPRLIPLTGYEARTALETAERLWSGVGTNKIRIVTPSSRGGAVRQRSPRGDEPPDSRPGFPPIPLPKSEKRRPEEKKPEAKKPAEAKPAPAKPPAGGAEKTTEAGGSRRNPFVFVHQVAPQSDPKKKPQAKAKPAVAQRETKPGAPIVVEITPAGIWIASEDLDALDEFERLLLQVTGTPSVGPQYTVFYLKYANATSVAELLTQIFGGGGGASGGGSLLGDLARGALGGGGGDLLGGLLGLGGGGGGASSSSVQIVAEARLNALIVQGSARDVDSIEQLLKVLDQKTGPEEVEVVSKPRLIPILNTSAEEIKAVVEQVYHDRILAAGGSGRQQQPSPEQFIRLLRGGRGGNRGGSQNRRDDPAQKIKLGIHVRTNSLIVIAPEPLFQEVLLLVEQLDTATTESNQIITTYTLRRSNPETVHKALTAILGDSIQSSGTKASSSSGRNGRPSTGRPQQGRPSTGFQQPSAGQIQDLIRRRLEAATQGNRGGDRGRGGPRGGGDRGRGGRR
ncbi:MAG: hypothetical protein IIA67_08640 [Planctomycetes bacterium]|nr:hypothetical protein [Planctomycetota bacterium]